MCMNKDIYLYVYAYVRAAAAVFAQLDMMAQVYKGTKCMNDI
jgi:hypothetical protein